MMRTALVTVCLFLVAGCALHRGSGSAAKAAPPVDPGKIRVMVLTTPPTSRVPVGDETTRAKTAALIADALGRKKALALVTDRAHADVVVDVRSAASVFDPKGESKFDDKAIPVDVHAAGVQVRMVESGFDRTRTANSVAKDVERWIQANRSKIVAARPPVK